jgi:hypothetical protein
LDFSRGPAASKSAKGFDGGTCVIGMNLCEGIAGREQLPVGIEDLE